MKSVSVKELKPGSCFSAPAYIDEGYILLTPETPLTMDELKHLVQWEFRELRSEGELVGASEEAEKAKEAASAAAAAAADAADAAEGAKAAADPAGAKDLVKPALGGDDKGRIQGIAAYYRQFASYVEAVYTRYVTKGEIAYKELCDNVKILCDTVSENRRYILRAQSLVKADQNYLVSHSVRSAILAIVLGSYIKLPTHRLIELGVAAVLHEIGMIRLPPQLYMANRQLTVQERKQITAHPIIGYNILKEKGLPLVIQLAALEHHERVNGSGYPRQLQADRISTYAKIIAVACSYDAVTSSRPYKEAKEGYAGMVDILKNEGKQYDELIIRALVYSLSIYPIGTYVLLTSGKKAQVVDVNPDNPRFPVIQLLQKGPDDKDIVVQTSETGLRILKPLGRGEIEAANALGAK